MVDDCPVSGSPLATTGMWVIPPQSSPEEEPIAPQSSPEEEPAPQRENLQCYVVRKCAEQCFPSYKVIGPLINQTIVWQNNEKVGSRVVFGVPNEYNTAVQWLNNFCQCHGDGNNTVQFTPEQSSEWTFFGFCAAEARKNIHDPIGSTVFIVAGKGTRGTKMGTFTVNIGMLPYKVIASVTLAEVPKNTSEEVKIRIITEPDMTSQAMKHGQEMELSKKRPRTDEEVPRSELNTKDVDHPDIGEIIALDASTSHSDVYSDETLLALGNRFMSGTGVPKDEKRAIQFYQLAANKNNAKAMYNLGVCYHHGLGVPKDMAKAVEFYTHAARLDHVDAMINLGWCYRSGVGVREDKNEAVKLYSRASDLGDADAMLNLAGCYEEGCGVEKDMMKAFEWYCRAAEKGNDKAMYCLALCYHTGKGVEEDIQQAIKWYTCASQTGNKSAEIILSLLKDKIREGEEEESENRMV